MQGRRITIDEDKQVRCEEFESPKTLGSGDILVRVIYSLISPGTELATYADRDVRRVLHPGYTAVGDVVDVGAEAEREVLGKTVFLFPERYDSSGCHASLKVFARGGLALPLPPGLDPKRACFARMVNIALTPYCNAAPKTMGSVLVIGLGLVGNMIGQVGRLRGLQVIGVDLDEVRRRRAEEAGFHEVLDPAQTDVVTAVRAATGGRGVELTVNATGHAAPFLTALEATAEGGEISTLGGARTSARADLKDVFSIIHGRHLVVRGGWELQLPFRSAAAAGTASIESNLRNAFRWVENGDVKLDPVWTHTIGPEAFQSAYDSLLKKDPRYLGVVVDWSDSAGGTL